MATVIPRAALGMRPGTKGKDVDALQSYLIHYGYLAGSPETHPEPHEALITAAAPRAQRGLFDDAMSEGLRRFQQFMGLAVTGEVDEGTLEVMNRKRCGQLDVGSFTTGVGKWATNELT